MPYIFIKIYVAENMITTFPILFIQDLEVKNANLVTIQVQAELETKITPFTQSRERSPTAVKSFPWPSLCSSCTYFHLVLEVLLSIEPPWSR
jgi:hypothetical protein